MTCGVAETMEAFPFFLPEQALFFAPAIVTGSLRSSGEFLRGHGTEMTSVLMQSLAEFLEDPYGFSIAGCGRFCAQVTNAVFESAAGHHEYNDGNACMRVEFLTVQDSRTGSEKCGRSCGKAARQYGGSRRPCLRRDCRRCQHRTGNTLSLTCEGNIVWQDLRILNRGKYGLSPHEGTSREGMGNVTSLVPGVPT